MVNYILSFCKITGASKIFSRHFYLPLLKPTTPREALRTFRVTGKWLLGAKIQHYIPVLLNHRKKRSKRNKNYGKLKHDEMDDYTYMSPVLDSENENHKILQSVLKSDNSSDVFVYTVEDKKYNIVLEAGLEFAIRDGEVIDVLVSQKSDKIIVKLKNYKKIPLEIQYYDKNSDNELLKGEGATTADIEQFHHHGKYTMSLAKLFEDKEGREEEEWEEVLRTIMRKRKRNPCEHSKEYREMVKDNLRHMDWDKFEEGAKKIIEEINEPSTEQPIDMDIDDLDKTKKVNEYISTHKEMLDQIPTISEISDVIRNMGSAHLHEMHHDSNGCISGVKITLSSGKEVFVSGQMVHTDDGDVFVPGQTIESEFGLEYQPGITVNLDNKPTLLSGLILGEEEKDAMFLPTQSIITADGQLTFATSNDERPLPPTEEQKVEKMKRKQSRVEEEIKLETIDTVPSVVLIVEEDEDTKSESSTESSIELNSSELEELDIEAIRQKQEQDKLEMERLMLILQDDGMDDLIESLEAKKRKLQQKLDEVRKLSMVENNLVTYATEIDANELVQSLENQTIVPQVIDILLTITRRASNIRDKSTIKPENIQNPVIIVDNMNETDKHFNCCSNALKILLKSAMVSANNVYKNRPKDQVLALNTIGDMIVETINNNVKIREELLEIMKTAPERLKMCDAIIKQLVTQFQETKTKQVFEILDKKATNEEVLSKLERLMKNNGDISDAFIKIAKTHDAIISLLKDNIKKDLENVTSDEEVDILLLNAIQNATKTHSICALRNLIENTSLHKDFTEETLSFAKALGHSSVVEIVQNTKLQDIKDESTLSFLKRVVLIRQLAEKDYSLKCAIGRIKKDPERARADPRIRQLVRESAILTTKPSTIKNAYEIPLDLMKTQNLLAIEDFLTQKAILTYPVLISRNTYEAVIPKEASRGVIAGRVAYTFINETGVINFKPMHMLSAVNVNQNREKRIDGYLSGTRETSVDRSLLGAKSNGSESTSGSSARPPQRMSSVSLYRGFQGPRA